MSSMTTKNSTDDNMQSCLTPKGAQRIPLCSTRHLATLYVDLMTDTNLLAIPLLFSAIQKPFLCMLSKTFSKSTKTRCKSERYSALCSMINRSVLMWPTQENPGLKPACSRSKYIHTFLARTPEIGQGLRLFLSCGARKPEQT